MHINLQTIRDGSIIIDTLDIEHDRAGEIDRIIRILLIIDCTFAGFTAGHHDLSPTDFAGEGDDRYQLIDRRALAQRIGIIDDTIVEIDGEEYRIKSRISEILREGKALYGEICIINKSLLISLAITRRE